MTNEYRKADMFKHMGWKYYNLTKKKAMEQEPSWSGLMVSLSIAFFVVFASANILNFTYQSITPGGKYMETRQNKIYQLESSEHLNPQATEIIDKTKISINFA